MPTIVQRVSNAGAQGTRWRATPNAHRRKDQTVKISENKEERTRRGWLIFTAVNWLSFIALQTRLSDSYYGTTLSDQKEATLKEHPTAIIVRSASFFRVDVIQYPVAGE
jgi:hypothetical protein